MDIKQLKTTTSWSLVCLWLVVFSGNVLTQDYSANMPAVYEEPGGVSARGADSSFGVESIDSFTGALKIVVTDLTIPSNGGLDLSVVRNYQSFVKLQGGLPSRTYQAGRATTGIGWDLHFGRLWKAGADGVAPQLAATNTTNGCRVTNITSVNNPVLGLPDGSRQLFAASKQRCDYALVYQWRFRKDRARQLSGNTPLRWLRYVEPHRLGRYLWYGSACYLSESGPRRGWTRH